MTRGGDGVFGWQRQTPLSSYEKEKWIIDPFFFIFFAPFLPSTDKGGRLVLGRRRQGRVLPVRADLLSMLGLHQLPCFSRRRLGSACQESRSCLARRIHIHLLCRYLFVNFVFHYLYYYCLLFSALVEVLLGRVSWVEGSRACRSVSSSLWLVCRKPGNGSSKVK